MLCKGSSSDFFKPHEPEEENVCSIKTSNLSSAPPESMRLTQDGIFKLEKSVCHLQGTIFIPVLVFPILGVSSTHGTDNKHFLQPSQTSCLYCSEAETRCKLYYVTSSGNSKYTVKGQHIPTQANQSIDNMNDYPIHWERTDRMI